MELSEVNYLSRCHIHYALRQEVLQAPPSRTAIPPATVRVRSPAVSHAPGLVPGSLFEAWLRFGKPLSNGGLNERMKERAIPLDRPS